MLEAACLELCSPEDQEKVRESLSKPAMKGVKLKVVQQKPGQVVKVHDLHIVLVRGGAVRSSSNMASCRDFLLRCLARQVYLRLDRQKVRSWYRSWITNSISWVSKTADWIGIVPPAVSPNCLPHFSPRALIEPAAIPSRKRYCVSIRG
jgi:hypothetical protein